MRNPWVWLGSAAAAFAVIIVSLWYLLRDEQPAPVAAADLKGKPKLVVLVVFDQMRGDYLKKWQPLFGDGGFKRLQKDGAWFTECHYPYAYTLTAPGHTSLVTGTPPSKHGIVANDWYDRATRESVSSVTPPPEERTKGPGPYRRMSESLGDVLLRVLLGKGRVASLGIKDRAAILMAALRAQICYWFSTSSGNFVTSPYYRPDPHRWVTKFNKTRMADRWLGKEWNRFDKQLDYAKFSGPDDFSAEGTGYLQGRTFPHPFQLGKLKDEKLNKQIYYNAVTCSPMGSEMLVEFAKTAIVNEKLGQSDSVDLLFLGFSSNDLIGHAWGPDSQEVLDVTLRSDRLVKDLLEFLDAKVGKNNYYFAVSADHGVCPLPEFARTKGKTAARIDPDLLTTRAEVFLNQKFLPAGKKAMWFEQPGRSNSWVYFNRAALKELKLPQPDVEKALAEWFNGQAGIEHAFTRTELMGPKKKDSAELFDAVQRSFHPDGSGDVMVILKPYHLWSSPTLSKNPEKSPAYRTSHGTPHAYDTHVPLLVMGPRVQSGTRDERIAPQALASILAEALGIPAPRDAIFPVPAGLFK
ncbi:MAG: alkaline phosphatase family protein [Planctomycetes bacterium]|nr:alkaline phosphatase family protein [Planctomycetota bacterium]